MIRDAHVNGIRLRYREEGGPDDRPLVLLHGRTADHNDWNGITQHFAGRGRHVLVPDLRGHGESEHPGAYALHEMAGDVAALLDHLKTGSVELIGHSLGALVATRVTIARPDLVSRLVLEDPPQAYAITGRPLIAEDGPASFDWRMMHQTEPQVSDPDPAWVAGLGTIGTPALVLSGGTASPFDAADIARRIPGARLVTVEAGHLIHVTARQEFLRVVDAFLDEDAR
ncbi:alpha/beta fold hydrolase [Nonomuraea sp. NPDC049421]|uniref:alpha/beta fold hydrolase n=1 Tax=Nonomuraea sp. NPDC049421 TaxID=3155275 RepID=UPI003414B3FC